MTKVYTSTFQPKIRFYVLHRSIVSIMDGSRIFIGREVSNIKVPWVKMTEGKNCKMKVSGGGGAPSPPLGSATVHLVDLLVGGLFDLKNAIATFKL